MGLRGAIALVKRRFAGPYLTGQTEHPVHGSPKVLGAGLNPDTLQDQSEASSLPPGQGCKGGLQGEPVTARHTGPLGNLIHFGGKLAQ